MRSEDRFVDRLREAIAGRADLLVGPGDDAAVFRSDGLLVVTTDTLVEGVDFLAGEDPTRLGRRAMSVALSDLAAMGAWPAFFLLTIGFPDAAADEFPLEIAVAAAARGQEFGAALAGGDLSRADQTFLSVTVWGKPAGEPILRSGARAGDILFLSGWLGEAAAGLAISRARAGFPAGPGTGGWVPEQIPVQDVRRLLAAYREPEPRLALGRALATNLLASAAIDVSDGLGIDSGRLARASGVRLVIESECVPLSPALRSFARLAGIDPVETALAAGDDYELLFTVSPANVGRFRDPPSDWGVEVRRIGRVETGAGAFLEDERGLRPVSGVGFDHFRGVS